MILRTKKLNKHFDGIVALENVSVEFLPGTITTLVGSNGAGKSTLFNAITGLILPDSGTTNLIGETELKLNGLAPFEIAEKGIGLFFQTVRVFPHLSVLENVAVGAPNQLGERIAKRRAANLKY
jgi:ABC-type branched-subunit amino acid transport system ATPase component